MTMMMMKLMTMMTTKTMMIKMMKRMTMMMITQALHTRLVMTMTMMQPTLRNEAPSLLKRTMTTIPTKKKSALKRKTVKNVPLPDAVKAASKKNTQTLRTKKQN